MRSSYVECPAIVLSRSERTTGPSPSARMKRRPLLAMPIARLILLEKSNRWAVALRRALGEREHVLRQTGSLAECGRSLAVSPASLVVVECRADNLDSLLSAAGQWSRQFPHARFAAVLD